MFKNKFFNSSSPRRYQNVAEGSSTDRTETTEQLSDFTPRKGDQGYVDSDDEEAEFSPRAMEQSLALSPKCKEIAKQLFTASASGDGSGDANISLVVQVLQYQDPELTLEDINATLVDVGITGKTMQWQKFYVWTHHVFGGFSEAEYLDAMATLADDMETVAECAKKLHNLCQPVQNVILVDTFVAHVQIAAPELSPADIEETIENTDGTMCLQQVQKWVANLLIDCGSKEDFLEMMGALDA